MNPNSLNISTKTINYVIYDNMSNRYGNSDSSFRTRTEASNFFKAILEALVKLDIFNQQGLAMYKTSKAFTILEDDFEINSSHFTPTGNLYMEQHYKDIAKKYLNQDNMAEAFIQDSFKVFIGDTTKKFDDSINLMVFGDLKKPNSLQPKFESHMKKFKKAKRLFIYNLIKFYDDNNIRYEPKTINETKAFIGSILNNQHFKNTIMEASTKNFSTKKIDKLVKNTLFDRFFFNFMIKNKNQTKLFLFENENSALVNKKYLENYTALKKLILEEYDSIKVRQYENKLRNNSRVKKNIDQLPKDKQDAWIKTMANAYYFYHDKKKKNKKDAEKLAAATAWKQVSNSK